MAEVIMQVENVIPGDVVIIRCKDCDHRAANGKCYFSIPRTVPDFGFCNEGVCRE